MITEAQLKADKAVTASRDSISVRLVVEALRCWRAAGGQRMLLDVNVNNPSAARVYARLGFDVIGRRARYVRPLA